MTATPLFSASSLQDRPAHLFFTVRGISRFTLRAILLSLGKRKKHHYRSKPLRIFLGTLYLTAIEVISKMMIADQCRPDFVRRRLFVAAVACHRGRSRLQRSQGEIAC